MFTDPPSPVAAFRPTERSWWRLWRRPSQWDGPIVFTIGPFPEACSSSVCSLSPECPHVGLTLRRLGQENLFPLNVSVSTPPLPWDTVPVAEVTSRKFHLRRIHNPQPGSAVPRGDRARWGCQKHCSRWSWTRPCPPCLWGQAVTGVRKVVPGGCPSPWRLSPAPSLTARDLVGRWASPGAWAVPDHPSR